MPIAIETFVDGIRLAGEIHLPRQGRAPFPAVVICHGIPSGTIIPDEPGYRPLAGKMAAAGMMALIFNFRGCGASEGNIDLAGWCRDLSGMIDLLWGRADVDRRRISLLGFSGGAAVSCKVAAQDQRVSCLALAACPAELSRLFPIEELSGIIKKAREMGVIREHGFPPDAVAWLEDIHSVRPEMYIGSITPRPVLILHGTADELVPVEDAYHLFELAHEPKQLWLLEGCRHRLRQEQSALEAATEWLSRINGV